MTLTDSTAFFRIPSHLDYLVCSATFPGFVSFRNKKDGSFFIQTLCRVLQARCRDTHILDMLSIVNRIVAFEFVSKCPKNPLKHNKKQMPCSPLLLFCLILRQRVTHYLLVLLM